MSKKVFGPPPPSERCVYKMWHRSYPRQCSNRGRFSEEGRLWCKIHAPSERQKRTDVAVAAYREKSSLAAERFLRSAACVSALDGLEPAGVAPLISWVESRECCCIPQSMDPAYTCGRCAALQAIGAKS